MPHIHELIDYTVVAYIVYQGKVLLCHHRTLDMWVPLGGHVELNEDPEEALFREIKEESGLEIELVGEKPLIEHQALGTKSLFPPTFMNIHSVSPTHRHVVLVYLAKTKSVQAVLAPSEHKQLRWCSSKDLAKIPLDKTVRYYADEALRRVMI